MPAENCTVPAKKPQNYELLLNIICRWKEGFEFELWTLATNNFVAALTLFWLCLRRKLSDNVTAAAAAGSGANVNICFNLLGKCSKRANFHLCCIYSVCLLSTMLSMFIAEEILIMTPFFFYNNDWMSTIFLQSSCWKVKHFGLSTKNAKEAFRVENLSETHLNT